MPVPSAVTLLPSTTNRFPSRSIAGSGDVLVIQLFVSGVHYVLIGTAMAGLGAAGYLNKSADSAQLIEAIRRVAGGRLFITHSVAEHLAASVGAGGRDDQPLHERLSQREYQVFRLLSQGRSVGEIAEQLALSPNTVSTYRARVLEKTGVRNDVELALYAVQHELQSN